MNHPLAGHLEFCIPLQNPTDVEAYLFRKLVHLPIADQMKIRSALLKRANAMWSSYSLWVGDPDEARLELRQDEEVARWFAA